MKIALQYVSDLNGNPQAVQLSLTDWEMILGKLKKYEEALKFKSDLKEAYTEVAALRAGKGKKENVKDFLNGL